MGAFEEITSDDPFRSDAAAVNFASTAGVISVAPDKGPVRTIITGGKRRATGRFFSVKNGRAMPWEAEHEEPFAFAAAEVETDCLAWIGQPCRIEIPYGAHWLRYFPDLARRDMVEGRWITTVFELKRDKEREVEDNNPEYKEKLDLAEALLRLVGATFEILDDSDLGTPVYRRNVSMIALDKNAKVRPSDIARARDIAGRSRQATYGELCEGLGGFIIGKKKVHALMIQRILSIPLPREITGSTTVSLVDRSNDPQREWEFFE